MKKRKNRLLTVLLVLSILLFLVGASMLGYYGYYMMKGRSGVDTLRAGRPGYSNNAGTLAGGEASNEERILQANAELHAQNPDFAAWITVDGTRIDYPVMYTPDDPEFYLHRSFDKEYSMQGTPFLAPGANPANNPDNVTVYGHNMRSGDMFADVYKFADKAFWDEHHTIQFSTLTDVYTYEVFAYFFTVLDDADPNIFRYDLFTHAADAAEFDAFVNRVQSLAYYDTGIDVQYKDKLITLSTCATGDSTDGKRVVIVAKRVD